MNKSSEQISEQVDEPETGQQMDGPSEKVVKLLSALYASPLSRAQLLGRIGLTNAYGNYQRHLHPLLQQGYLALTIPDKPNSQHQRYRLTPAGERLLDKYKKSHRTG